MYMIDPAHLTKVCTIYSGYTYTQNSVTVGATTCKATSSTSTSCNSEQAVTAG